MIGGGDGPAQSTHTAAVTPGASLWHDVGRTDVLRQRCCASGFPLVDAVVRPRRRPARHRGCPPSAGCRQSGVPAALHRARRDRQLRFKEEGAVVQGTRLTGRNGHGAQGAQFVLPRSKLHSRWSANRKAWPASRACGRAALDRGPRKTRALVAAHAAVRSVASFSA